jgi:uncharacterized protein YegJ (DUF2314 family)
LPEPKFGQTITFKEDEIVDWLYLEDGKMIGNFTACAMLKREPPQEAEKFIRQFGLRCDPARALAGPSPAARS